MPVVEVVFGKGRASRWYVLGALEALAFWTPSSHLFLSNLGEGPGLLWKGAPPALGAYDVGWGHRIQNLGEMASHFP